MTDPRAGAMEVKENSATSWCQKKIKCTEKE